MNYSRSSLINDELIWQSVNRTFCSFKSKVETHNFCRHEMNVTGLCNKSACPLANSKYATIREEAGRCYLYVKAKERAHTPAKLWEKTLLPRNYEQALQIVSTRLEHFPKFLVHRTKQRLTRIHQYLIRMRKLALQTRPVLVPEHVKVDRRETRREAKALQAAKVNQSIQQELLARLKQGTYGDIYNFPALQYNDALDDAQTEAVPDQDIEEADDQHILTHFVEGDFEDEDDDLEAVEDAAARAASGLDDDDVDVPPKKRRAPTKAGGGLEPRKAKRRASQAKTRVEIEYDEEEDDGRQLAAPLHA